MTEIMAILILSGNTKYNPTNYIDLYIQLLKIEQFKTFFEISFDNILQNSLNIIFYDIYYNEDDNYMKKDMEIDIYCIIYGN